MKKTLAILLSLALVICMIPATAFAGSDSREDLATKATVAVDNAIYTGAAVTPNVTVTVGGKTLTKDTDYEVSYTNNISIGTGKVTVTGKSVPANPSEGDDITGYMNSKEATFTISALDLSNAIISTTSDILSGDVSGNTLTDDGKAKITIMVGNIDVKSTSLKGDVTIDYVYTAASGNTPASVTVTVKDAKLDDGNVVNSRSNTFTVKTDISTGYKVELSSSNETFTYNGSAQVPRNGVVVKTTDGKTVLPSSAYTVAYSNNVNGGVWPTVTISAKGTYSGGFSASNVYYINPKSIDSYGVSVTAGTGTASVRPDVVVKDGSTVLKENTDYVLSFSGTNTVTVEGRGNYTGTRSQTYTIVDKYLTNVTVNSYSTIFNGSTQQANITVTGSDGRTDLVRNVDYKVSYNYTDPITNKEITTDSPKDSAKYTITVTGIGKYAGTISGNAFIITPIPLDWAEIVLGSSTVLYNGVYVPKVTVRHISGNYYFSERDYKVTYRNVNSSSYYLKPTVVVTPVAGGNLSGTMSGSATKTELTKEFSLASRSLSNCTVTFTDSRSSKNYDGNASFKPPVTVKDYSLNRTLTENLDYKITYKDAAGKVVYALKDAGTYSVIVEGINAYTGTKTLTFTINGTDISGYTVTLKEASVNATGYAQTPVITSVKKGYYYSLTSNDYTVTYQDSNGKTVSSMSAPGTYKVVVTGKNGYSGSTYATFRIVGLPQTVTVTQDSYKVYATSDSFKITAKASGDATGFTYTSSNPAVASVSSTGYVTMHKVGRAVITVTATGMKKYDPASTTVEVKVYPKKGYITKKPWTDGKKYQAKVRWTYQDGATSYQVRYSRDKNFGAGTYKTKTVKAHGKDYTTQSTTLKSLKSKSTYYIKVRAVYTDPVTGDTYYGAWSGWRSVKTK